MNSLLDRTTALFDRLHRVWERDGIRRAVAVGLVLIFLVALIAIELNRRGLLPQALGFERPINHYMAINLAFTLVLILEVISLIFTLHCSVSRALGKQFEILALIFLRSSFKELTVLPEPITIAGHLDVLWRIGADGIGAVAVFGLLGLYSAALRQKDEALRSGPSLDLFVAAKKAVALLLLMVFFGMGLYNGWLLATGGRGFEFFQHFYTVLIFTDILLVLVSHYFLPEFRAVFRNSGYALCTLLIRLAVTAPPFYNVLIGVSSAALAVILTFIYNKFYMSETKEGDL
ncbi:MAG: hypothetical protein R3231_06955 [bacterium]|nr:hypothetical protein [bacterium]